MQEGEREREEEEEEEEDKRRKRRLTSQENSLSHSMPNISCSVAAHFSLAARHVDLHGDLGARRPLHLGRNCEQSSTRRFLEQ